MLLCQSFCWRQRSLEVAQDIALQRRRSQARGISQRASRAGEQRQRRNLGENEFWQCAQNSSVEPSGRRDDQAYNPAVLDSDVCRAAEKLACVVVWGELAGLRRGQKGVGAEVL